MQSGDGRFHVAMGSGGDVKLHVGMVSGDGKRPVAMERGDGTWAVLHGTALSVTGSGCSASM